MAESHNTPKRPRVDEDASSSTPDPLAALIAANISLQQQLALAADDVRKATAEANERAAAATAKADERVAKADERVDAATAEANARVAKADERAAEANARAAEANARAAEANARAAEESARVAKADERAAAAADDARLANERAAEATARADERVDAANEDTRRANEDTRRAYSIIETAVGAMKEMVTMSRQNVTNVRAIQASETSLVRYIKSEDTPDATRFVCVTFERDDEIVRAQFIDTDRFDETEAIAGRHSKRTRTISSPTAFEMEQVVRDHGNEMLKRRKIESVSRKPLSVSA